MAITRLTLHFSNHEEAAKFIHDHGRRMRAAGFRYCTVIRTEESGGVVAGADYMWVGEGVDFEADWDYRDWARHAPAPGWNFD